MDSSTGNKAAAKEKKRLIFGGFLSKLRKRHIIETLAAFIGGGWLLVEVVERLLVGHYKFPDETIDLTVVSVIGALLATLVWRWFGGTDKRPGNIKVEVLMVPLIILATLSVDLIILMEIIGISGKTFLIAAVAACLGIAWIILKSLQWAAAAPVASSGPAQKPNESPSSASAPPEKSIVVLPFSDLSPQKDQEYFCDGMTEEIITDLCQVHSLRVISRNSAMTFKATQKTTGTIGQELNVRYVLEGSVRKAGNDLRITAQLIDSKTDTHIWAEKYVGNLDDIFDLQERLARRIVAALKATLTSEEDRRLAARPISDFRAYDAWLRAKKEVWAFTKDGFDRAYELVNHALNLAGDNALLYAGLGWFHALSYDFGISHDRETLSSGERYAGRALELDPALGFAHFAMGWVRYKQGDFESAVKEVRRALEQDRSPDALWMLGFVLAEVGRIADARRFAIEAVAADPLNGFSGFARGAVDFFDGRFDEAATWFRDYLVRVAPGDPILVWWLAQALAYSGRIDEAKLNFEKVAKMEAVPLSDLSALFCQALEGNRSRVQELLASNTTLHEAAKTDEWFPNFIAACLVQVGDNDGALEWLERAVTWGFSNHRFLSEHSRFLAPLRGDPRFQALMERARKKQQAFIA
jgi:TolB-like protein